MSRRTLAALAVSTLCSLAPVFAQESAGYIKCPCWDCSHPHFMKVVKECGCRYADEIRAELVELEKQRKTRTEIEDHFIARFGEECLAEPRPKGFGLAARSVGWVALCVGAVVVFLLGRKWKARAVEGPRSAPGEVPPGDAEKVRRALEQEAQNS